MVGGLGGDEALGGIEKGRVSWKGGWRPRRRDGRWHGGYICTYIRD